MLQQDFTLPLPEVANRETTKRLIALKAFLPRIKSAITSLTVTGSMASGQNYAVTEKSDLDMQITITPESVKHLKNCDLFTDSALDQTLEAYLSGLIGQFSFSLDIDGIAHECHFWDEQALINAMEMKTQTTKRIRTSNTTPAVDYGFAFDGTQNAYTCPTTEESTFFISVLPSYRYVANKLFLSRPVTNWLCTPLQLFGEELLAPHIATVWKKVVTLLSEATTQPINLSKFNVLNALPSKFKASPNAKKKIVERTKQELDTLGILFQ